MIRVGIITVQAIVGSNSYPLNPLGFHRQLLKSNQQKHHHQDLKAHLYKTNTGK